MLSILLRSLIFIAHGGCLNSLLIPWHPVQEWPHATEDCRKNVKPFLGCFDCSRHFRRRIPVSHTGPTQTSGLCELDMCVSDVDSFDMSRSGNVRSSQWPQGTLTIPRVSRLARDRLSLIWHALSGQLSFPSNSSLGRTQGRKSQPENKKVSPSGKTEFIFSNCPRYQRFRSNGAYFLKSWI